MKKRRALQMGREKKQQPGNSLPRRGISLMVAAALTASMVFGGLDVTDVSASEPVLVCGQSEHTHSEGCYENQLTCGQEEHTHGDGCYDENGGLICGRSEHTHSDGCYTKTLVCGQSEHTHDDGCYQMPETQPQTKAETVPETTQTEASTEKQTQQAAEVVTEQQTAASETVAFETANTSETKSQATESGETVGEKIESETVKESETKKAAELKLSVSSKQSYAVAGRDALEFSTKLSGGTEPYTVKYEIKLDGKTVYEQDGFAETVTYQPESYGEHTLYMTVTDAAGQTNRAQYTVPVSVNETENSGVWQQSVQSVTLTGDYAKDIVAIAKTQLGNKENKKNFLINKEGTKQYYSRYGQWYGDTYEEWSAMFASFCAAYANIPEQYLPREKSVSGWVQKLGSRYVGADGYTPQAGDLVFFSENLHKDGTAQLQSGSPAHVGIVIDVDTQNIYTIEGNAGGEVSRQQYGLGDSHITGYMSMAKVMEMAGKLPEETDTEAAEESESETEAAFETVNITIGDKAYWVMGHEGTEHSWETLDESVIRILDDSGAMAKIEAVAKGVVFLAHTYNADGATRMETFEVHVAEMSDESESESESETESETELQSESETEMVTELESETESETELQSESETEMVTELESETESESETEEISEDTIFTKEYKDDEIEVKVSYSAAANIPENAEFIVTKMDSNAAAQAAEVPDTETQSAEVQDTDEQALDVQDADGQSADDQSAEAQAADVQTGDTQDTAAQTAEVTESYLYDMGFYVDGEEIEPEDAVSLEVKFLNGEFAEAETIRVLHYKEDGTETIHPTTNTDESGNVGAAFEMGSFSLVEFQAVGIEPYAITGATTVKVGEKITLTGSTGEKASWMSSDTNVATVKGNNNNTATVTGVKAGRVTITHTYYDTDWNYKTESYSVTVIKNGTCTISFNKNGGSGSVESITVKGGEEITFPVNGFTYSNKVFVGWSTDSTTLTFSTSNDNAEQHHRSTVYQPGDSYTVIGDTTFYAIWADQGVTSSFYIRLDGTIPTEPAPEGSSNDYGATSYTRGVTLENVLKIAKFYANTAGVNDNLNSMPSNDQLVAMINDNYGDRNNTLGFTVEKKTVDGVEGVYVKEITNSNSNFVVNNNLQVGERVYVLWYVVKKASAGPVLSGYDSCNWHVDGTLLVGSKVNLIYDVNAPTGVWTVVPVGTQWEVNSIVKAGTNNTLNEDKGNNRNTDGKNFENNIVTPARTDGYNFAGWKKYTKDEDGDYTVTDDSIYQPREAFRITEDTKLVAQWTKGTNFLTVKKTNEAGTTLQGAEFKLDFLEDDGKMWTSVTEATTDTKGEFTYQDMKNQTLYRMTETYAPNGYEVRNTFYFKVTVDEHTSDLLNLYLCKEDGTVYDENDSEKPEWVTVDYQPASTAGGTGVAQLKITIKDEQIRRKVSFKKYKEDGTTLAGAEFTLYTTDAEGQYTEEVGTAVSGTDGAFSFTQDTTNYDGTLPYGSYMLVETKAPDDYVTAEPIYFTINDPTDTESGIGGLVLDAKNNARKDVAISSARDTRENDVGLIVTTYVYEVSVTDALATQDITIQKEWEDFENQYDTRSKEIQVKLERKDKADGTAEWEKVDEYSKIILSENTDNSEKSWTVKIPDMMTKYDYRITEISAPSGYTSSSKTETDENGNITITLTNTLNWQIVKRSSSTGNPLLGGAEFELKNADGTVVITGVSEEKTGIIKWSGEIADGSYTLTETKAPVGYTLGKSWNVTVTDGLPTIENQTPVKGENGLTFYYDDDVLYSLPSTGGRGIYWYLIGGMLLMMAASLILYKNKREEVLKG